MRELYRRLLEAWNNRTAAGMAALFLLTYLPWYRRHARKMLETPEPYRTEDLHGHLNTVDAPLNTLGERELCPGSAALDKINASLR